MAEEKWIAPRAAADRISKRTGYEITPDDLKQMRRRGVIKNTYEAGERITLYDKEEIDTVQPPKKRNPVPYIEGPER